MNNIIGLKPSQPLTLCEPITVDLRIAATVLSFFAFDYPGIFSLHCSLSLVPRGSLLFSIVILVFVLVVQSFLLCTCRFLDCYLVVFFLFVLLRSAKVLLTLFCLFVVLCSFSLVRKVVLFSVLYILVAISFFCRCYSILLCV